MSQDDFKAFADAWLDAHPPEESDLIKQFRAAHLSSPPLQMDSKGTLADVVTAEARILAAELPPRYALLRSLTNLLNAELDAEQVRDPASPIFTRLLNGDGGPAELDWSMSKSDALQKAQNAVLGLFNVPPPSSSPTTFDMKGKELIPEVLSSIREHLGNFETPTSRPVGFSIAGPTLRPPTPFEPGQIGRLSLGPFQPPEVSELIFDEASRIEWSVDLSSRLPFELSPSIREDRQFVVILNIDSMTPKRHRKRSTMRLRHYSRMLSKRANRDRRRNS